MSTNVYKAHKIVHVYIS